MESGVRSRRKALIQALVLSLILAVVIGHTIYWQIEDEHAALFEDVQEGKDLLPVLYNLGLMLVTGTLLGLLLIRLSEALGYEAREISHFEEESEE
jgi:hypothetical protein